jgi:hypothetical protein
MRNDLSYAAGLFDGEGCISLVKAHHSYRLTVVLNMVTADGPEFMQKLFGGRIYIQDRSRQGNRRDTYFWTLWLSEDIWKMCDALKDLVVTKGPQVRLAMAYITATQGKRDASLRESFRAQFKELNKRGRPAA